MCLMILIASANTFSRYLLNSPVFASDEIVLTLFIWTIFLGASYCYKKNLHIGVDILVNLMPRAFQTSIKIIVDLVLLATNIMMAYLSLQLAGNSMIRMIPLLQIPYAVRNFAAFVGFTLMSIYSICFFVRDLKALLTRPRG